MKETVEEEEEMVGEKKEEEEEEGIGWGVYKQVVQDVDC